MQNKEQIVKDTKSLVADFLKKEKSGHGFDHIERVYYNATKLAKEENADLFIVSLASLLHDIDDEKIAGEECAKNLTNTRNFLQEIQLPEIMTKHICEIINTMSYSKSLEGVRPQTLEAQIVSDADKLDAMGAIGTIRTLAYGLSKGNPIFLSEEFPILEGISKENYRSKNRKNDTAINHFFEKLLLLKNLMYTNSGKAEAERRHLFMVHFLTQFFEEQDKREWIELLERFK